MTPRQRLLARMAGNIAGGLASRLEYELSEQRDLKELSETAVVIAGLILDELGVPADEAED